MVDVGEIQANAKQLGVEIAELLTNYEKGSTADQIVAPIDTGPESRAALISTAQPLIHPGRWSRGHGHLPAVRWHDGHRGLDHDCCAAGHGHRGVPSNSPKRVHSISV